MKTVGSSVLCLVLSVIFVFAADNIATAQQPQSVVQVRNASSGLSVTDQREICNEFQTLVEATYNFKPSKLTEDEKTQKSAEMDKIWDTVKADPPKLLPCLREAISLRTSDLFFRFDASNLLIQLDQSADSKKTLIRAYAEVDLDDVNMRYWILHIAKFGYEGFDTSAAGENWLKNPKSSLYPHRPGIRPVKDDSNHLGALMIYGSMDESIALPALVKIASQENHRSREIALSLLMRQATPESLRELKKLDQKGFSAVQVQSINSLLAKPDLLAPREGTPKITREQYLDAFQKLVEGDPATFLRLAYKFPDGEKDAIAVMKQADIPLIRKVRRFFASHPHDPYLEEWYKSFTDILMALTWKYKKQRNQEK